VLPRAKTKMALGHALALPLSSSVLEEPNWRASRSPLRLNSGSGAAMGEAVARVARMARRVMERNFILKLVLIRDGMGNKRLDGY
jgi:hypothetical protein